MKCVICKHGETKPGTTTVTFDRAGTTLVVREVPARICVNCGEEYVDSSVARELLARAEQLAKSGSQVAVQKYIPGMAMPF